MAMIRPLITQKDQKTVGSSTVFFNDERIADKDKNQPLLALLVEAGSSQVAVELVDLVSYESIAETHFENVMNELAWDMLGRVEAVKTSRVDQAELSSNFFQKIKEEASRLTEDIRSIVFIGLACNSPTAHLLMQQPVEHLGKTPEKFSSTPSFQKSFYDLGFKDWGEGLAATLPNINTFIGGDNIAALTAVGLEELELVIDLGASCEFFLKKGTTVYATSCESRAIFEGYFLDLLEPLRPGSIIDFEIKRDSCIWKTFDNQSVSRFSIYGLLHFFSCFLEEGYINPHGKLASDIPFKQAGSQLLLDEEAQLSLSEKDIQALRFVKGSIHSALTILLEKSQVDPGEVTGVTILGQSDNHLFGDSLIRSGFLAEDFSDKIRFGGNPVIDGIKKRLRGEEEPVGLLEYIELSAVPGYYQFLAQAMQLSR